MIGFQNLSDIFTLFSIYIAKKSMATDFGVILDQDHLSKIKIIILIRPFTETGSDKDMILYSNLLYQMGQ